MSDIHKTRNWFVAFLLLLALLCAAGLWGVLVADSQPDLPDPASDLGSASLAIRAADAAPFAEVPGVREVAYCLVEVVDTGGVAVAGAEVMVWRDQQSGLLTQSSDSAGSARFPGFDGSGVLVAVAPWGAFHAVRAPQVTGTHVLVVGGAAVLQGVVLVDGLPARAGLKLTLQTKPGRSLSGAAKPLVARVREAAATTTCTGPDGRFSFSGLPIDWQGAVLPPITHWISLGQGQPWEPQKLQLTSPDSQLVLRLTMLPTVSGRVVWDDDGTPVDSASLALQATFGGELRGSANVATDADGRFEVGLTPNVYMPDVWGDPEKRPSVEHVRVICFSVAGGADGVQADATIAGGIVEPVELRVRRAPRVHFLGVDTAGEPIPFTRVDVDASVVADRDGRGYFNGPPPSLVGAPNCAVVPAVAQRGSGSHDNPLVFVMPPRNTLRIHVDSAAPLPSSSVRVFLVSDGPLMAGRRRWRPFDAGFGGESCSTGRFGVRTADGYVQKQKVEADADASGVVELHSLEPHIDCVLSVRDQLGHILAETVLRTPAYGERAEARIRVQASPRRIAGVVRDEGGVALPQAEVRLGIGERSELAITEEDGTFEFVAYSEAPADLRVSAAGYVTEWRRGLALSANTKSLDYRLRKGHTYSIRVREIGGAAVPLFAMPAGFEFLQAQRTGEGDYLWHDLPELVEFYVDLQGQRFTVTCDSSVSTATLQLPQLSRVSVPATAMTIDVTQDLADYRVSLRSQDEPVRGEVLLEFSVGEPRWGYLLPGSYVAKVVVRRQSEGVGADFVPLAIRKQITLQPGAELQLDFH